MSTYSTKAKYVALSKAGKDFLWLKTAPKDLRVPEIPMVLICDNCSVGDLL
jgi:hypothetical protein